MWCRITLRGTDELGEHDQRRRRRLREAQPIQRLAGSEPSVLLHGLLRDIGEDGVDIAKGDEGQFKCSAFAVA